MTDLGDPTGWTDRERAFFAAGWNDCIAKQPGEVERLRKGIQDFLDGNYDHPRAHRHEPAMGCRHGRHYYETCDECDAAYFSGLLGEECLAPDHRPNKEQGK